MSLPLESHPYGEHEIVLPPDDPTALDGADVPMETRLAMYEMLQELRLFEKRAYDLFMQQLVKGTSHLSLGMEAVKPMTFRSEHITEGKIAINEEKATPIYPPYAGRVTRLMAKPGDMVEFGQPLFYIEAADMVQAQNDFLTALAAINRAK